MLPTLVVRATSTGEQTAYDGVVEAVRQTVIAAQVQGPSYSWTLRRGPGEGGSGAAASGRTRC